MTTNTINGTYGSLKTPCEVFIYENRNGSKWYCADGSVNVNLTYDEINEGCDIEELQDMDCFTCMNGINTIEDLIEAVEN